MPQLWADRQRRTNALVRAVGTHVLQGQPSGNQLMGLCRLTWITDPHNNDHRTYINSTKVPGLSAALGADFDGLSIEEVAGAVASTLGAPEVAHLVIAQTGFTNLYKAYRNSAEPWAHLHRAELADIFRRALALKSDEDGAALAASIASLPGVPRANHAARLMRAEYLVTPVCFALDPRMRFPIINGADRVRSVLRQVGEKGDSAVAKYRALVSLIGKGGVQDAADVDQLGVEDQVDLARQDTDSVWQLLQQQPEEGDNLPSKEEDEVERLQQALTGVQRRVHNKITNQLRQILSHKTLQEGRRSDCRYDVLVRSYDGDGNDLLIEVKSSADPSQIRMSIGQLYTYWYGLKGPTDDPHIALLLPSRPERSVERLLDWLGIGLLWIEDGTLTTCTEWLHPVATPVNEWPE